VNVEQAPKIVSRGSRPSARKGKATSDASRQPDAFGSAGVMTMARRQEDDPRNTGDPFSVADPTPIVMRQRQANGKLARDVCRPKRKVGEARSTCEAG